MALTPQRTRFEAEAPERLSTRRPIPLVALTTSFQTILTARADADFLVQALWVAERNGGTHDYTLCLVPPAGSASAANAVAFEVTVATRTTASVVGGAGLLVPPGYTLQALADTADRINIFGWGYDLIGSYAQDFGG